MSALIPPDQRYWMSATLAVVVFAVLAYAVAFLAAALLDGMTGLPERWALPVGSLTGVLVAVPVAMVLRRWDGREVARGIAAGLLAAGGLNVVVGVGVGILG
ncbi:hypothetical protein [Nocardia sp. AG03]|uniref:hypothetical protein n=1 Tax=Nocardia sp. AG03 TaxID=3025312 RepID=UPI0024183768|nr:hypothetical protein [Nocardia sp. AG03]